jgi:hypothetical protein
MVRLLEVMMGDVVEMQAVRRVRSEQAQREAHADIAAAIVRGEGCPWSEDDLAGGWSDFVRA